MVRRDTMSINFKIRNFRVCNERVFKASATVLLCVEDNPILSIMEAYLIEKRNGTLSLIMPNRYPGRPLVKIEDSQLHNSIQRAMIRRWMSMNGEKQNV